MEKELNKFLIFVGIAIAVVLYVIYNTTEISNLRVENSRLLSNNESLVTGNEYVRMKNKQLATTVEGLELDNSELKNINTEFYNKLKYLGVKYDKTSSVAQALATENKKLSLALKNTQVIVSNGDTVYLDTLKCFSYNSKYDSISGCIDGDSVSFTKKTTVPVSIVMENIYKHKFLWWSWGIKNRKLLLTSDNQDIKFTDVKLYIPK